MTVVETKITRRDTLKWMAIATPLIMIGACYAPEDDEIKISSEIPEKYRKLVKWPDINIPDVTHEGYGKDPDLILPKTPWPLLLNAMQLNACVALIDLLVPADDKGPAASEVGVQHFMNEWVSAPYPSQSEDRELIIPGLQWLDDEAKKRGNVVFASLPEVEQIAILDDLSDGFDKAPSVAVRQMKPMQFFGKMRRLSLGGYYTTAHGMEDIAYIGNEAIAGDYPGPSDEALKHLSEHLAKVGLKLP